MTFYQRTYKGMTHTIYSDDCRNVTLEQGSVDCLITDPPYGIAYKARKNHDMIVGDEDNSFVADALKHSLRALAINRHFYVFGPDVVSPLTVCPTVQIVWDKGRMSAGGRSDYPWSAGHELITFGMYSRFKSHANVGNGSVKLRRSTVIRVPKQSNGRGSLTHPNQKPVDLIRVLIEASTNHGETVFDPFAGSGTLGVAAALLGRSSVQVEVDAKYAQIAADRLDAVLDWLKKMPS